MLEAQLKLQEAKLETDARLLELRAPTSLAEEIAAEREQWDMAVTQVTDLSDDRTALEEKAAPRSKAFPSTAAASSTPP